MFSKDQLERYSDVLLWGLKTARREPYAKGDLILLRFDLSAIPLAEVLQGKLLDSGYNPVLRPGGTPVMEHQFYEKANQAQLTFIPPGEVDLFKALNGNIFLHAPASLTHLSDIDPKKIGKAAVARKALREILDGREAEGRFGWTLCTVPTEELARQARLSLEEYSDQVVRACYLDRPDPVKAWREIHREAQGIKDWLNGMEVDALHIESDHTDLVVKPGKMRKWIGISGHNIPSFEVFLSPDWRGTTGIYYADQPSFRSGNYVEGVRLTFERGVARTMEAEKGGEFLRKQLTMDKGASRVGEFSLTDKRFSRIDRFMANTLYDENFGGEFGNCHLAVGASYADTFAGDPDTLTKDLKRRLGFNDSALHWDLVNTERKRVSAVLASGRRTVIYEDGQFQH